MLIGLCSYKNVLAIWGHSRWKFTFTQIVSLRAFSFVLTAILNSQAGCRCTLVPRLPFPVPRSPFPVPGISNIQICVSWLLPRRVCMALRKQEHIEQFTEICLIAHKKFSFKERAERDSKYWCKRCQRVYRQFSAPSA